MNTNSYKHYDLPIDFPCIAFLKEKKEAPDKVMQTKHFHNFIEVLFCQTGSGTLSVENDNFSFHAGNFCFIPENVAHKIQPLQDAENLWEYLFFDPFLLFKNSMPESDLNELLKDLPHCFGVISKEQDKELHFLLECIFSELHKKEPFYQDSLKGLFLSLLMLVKRNKDINTFSHSDFQWLYSAIDYIRNNYQEKLSIPEIAEEYCGLSESHFRKKFVETMHISPLDYINQFRIRIACQEIYHNEKSLNKIASDVGFSTLSSFNRNFHALLGCSPREWRKKQLTD